MTRHGFMFTPGPQIGTTRPSSPPSLYSIGAVLAREGGPVDAIYGINGHQQEWADALGVWPVKWLRANGFTACTVNSYRQDPTCFAALMEQLRPRIFVNCAMLWSAMEVERAAEKWPKTIWLTVCHSSQSDLAREPGWLIEQMRHVNVALRRRNCYYGLVDERTSFHRALHCYRVLSIPNVVLDPPEKYASRTNNVKPHRVSLVCHARALKNIPNQILAAGLVEKKHPITLSIVVKNDSQDALVRFAQFVLGTVEVIPWQEWAAYRRFIAEWVDVGLQASFTESFNFVAMEHMQSRKPVIGSSAIRFLPSAWQADPDDPQDIADKLLYVLKRYRRSSNKAAKVAAATAEIMNKKFKRAITYLLAKQSAL